MRKLATVTALTLGFAGLPLMLPAQAADAPRTDDQTMQVVDNGQAGSEREALQLPDESADQGRVNSEQGLDTANDARENGRDFGQGQAGESRPQDAGQPAGAGQAGNHGRPQ